MPRTKVKKGVPTEEIRVQIKSEPVERDSTSELSLNAIIARGDIMKSTIEDLVNKKRQEVKTLCNLYRKQFGEISSREESTLPEGTVTNPTGQNPTLNLQDSADILPTKGNTTVYKDNHIYNEFKTPHNPTVVSSFHTITPKVPPNIPLALLRRPKIGEMIMSLNGSPIMPNTADSEAASINIPMVDGTVMSIIPEEVLPIEDVPLHVDPQAKQHLKILYNRLKCIVDDKM